MSSPFDPAGTLEKARRALVDAQLLLNQSSTEGACNRAYFAMFHAAHAALWSTGAEQPGAIIKTHAGLLAVFGQQLVKTGKVDAAHGRALGQVQKTRLLADYTADPPSEADAREALALAEEFVAAIAAGFPLIGSPRGKP